MYSLMKIFALLLNASLLLQCPFLNTTPQEDYVKALQWLHEEQHLGDAKETFLNVRTTFPEAYKNLILTAYLMNDRDLALQYAAEAVRNGYPECNFDIGWISEQLGREKDAIKHYQLAADTSAEPIALAYLGKIAMRQKDIKAGKEYFELSARLDKGSLAQYLLAFDLLRDPEEKNIAYIARLLLDFTEHKPLEILEHDIPSSLTAQYKNMALVLLGYMYETGMMTNRPNQQKAAEYYKRSKNPSGKVQLARLIWTKKIPGSLEEAKATFEEHAKKDVAAAFLYTSILIGEGKESEAMNLLAKVSETFNAPMHAISDLQLAIAYHFGCGIEKNESQAQILFQSIQDRKFTSKSVLLALGYMHLLGLGVEKDEKTGFDLIDRSQHAFDDLYLSVDELFPRINQMRTERSLRLQEELLKEEEAEQTAAQKTKKQPKPAKQKSRATTSGSSHSSSSSSQGSSSSSHRRPVESFRDILTITPTEWNATFTAPDGSMVSNVDPVNRTFTIDDPQRNEQLIVQVKDKLYRDFGDIEDLRKAPRIAERQGLGGTKKLARHTIYDHSFAEMLDYVIQYVGDLVPWIKNGSAQPQDQLIADVIRKNVATNDEIRCRAEYTFGLCGGKTCVYHRLLRPIAQPVI